MLKFLGSILFTGIAFFIQAQITLDQTIIAEGGNFGQVGNMVKFAHYDYQSNQSTYFFERLGDFNNDLIIHGHIAYLHVGKNGVSDYIYKYDLASNELLDSVNIPGVQRLLVYQNYLVASGGFGADSNFLQIIDRNEMDVLASFNEVDIPALGMEVVDNQLYVAMNGSWPSYTDSGTVAIINLSDLSFNTFIKTDTFSKVISDVYSYNNNLYFLSDNYIVEYDPSSAQWTNHNVGFVSGGAGVLADSLYAFFNGLEAYDLTNNTIVPSSQITTAFYARAKMEATQNLAVVQTTDYFSYTDVMVYNLTGVLVDSLRYGPSGNALDFWYNGTAPIANADSFSFNFQVDSMLDVLANDTDQDPMYINWVGESMIPSTTVSIENNKLHYQPTAGIVTQDSFEYEVCDQFGFCAKSYVLVDIKSPSTVNIVGENTISLFPNPAVDFISIGVYQFESVAVYDENGRLLIEDNRKELDIRSLPAGLYTVIIQKDRASHQTKFIKM